MQQKIKIEQTKEKNTKNGEKPLKKYWNKLFWSNLAMTYGVIMLILSMVFQDNMYAGYGQVIGNIVCSSLIILFSLLYTALFSFLILKRGEKPFDKKMMIATIITSLCVPLVGAVMVYLWKRNEKKYAFESQAKKDKSFTKPKSFVPTSFTILFILTLFVILIIWLVYVITGGIYDTNNDTWYQAPGLLDVFIAPINGFVDAADLVVFLLVMGGFLQIINETKSLEAGVGALVKKMKGKEIWLIPILMLLFSIGGTTFGMCEETIPFYLIVIPIMLAGGFDVLTAILVILLGAGMGVAGSIINPFVINAAVDAANTGAGSEIVSMSDGIAWRALGYVALVATSITGVTLYARKVKKDQTKSVLYWNKKELEKAFSFDQSSTPAFTGKRKATLWIFAASFVVMIIMVISWGSIFPSFEWFDNFNHWLELYFPFVSSNGAIGTWYLLQMAFIFFLASIIIAIINWKDEQSYLNSFFTGAKDFLGVAIVISVARGLSLILINSGVNELIVGGLGSIFGNMPDAATMLVLFIIFLGLSFLIPSTSGFASAVFPSVGPALSNIHTSVSGAITSFSYASGFVNICSPTGGVFVAVLGIGKTSLPDFYKGSYKILLALFAVMLIIIISGSFLPSLF